jgi:hypothetical protein
MEGNPRDPSHLRVRELLVWVVLCPIIAQICPTPYQIQVQVGRDNKHTCESLFFSLKYIYIYILFIAFGERQR